MADYRKSFVEQALDNFHNSGPGTGNARAQDQTKQAFDDKKKMNRPVRKSIFNTQAVQEALYAMRKPTPGGSLESPGMTPVPTRPWGARTKYPVNPFMADIAGNDVTSAGSPGPSEIISNDIPSRRKANPAAAPPQGFVPQGAGPQGTNRHEEMAFYDKKLMAAGGPLPGPGPQGIPHKAQDDMFKKKRKAQATAGAPKADAPGGQGVPGELLAPPSKKMIAAMNKKIDPEAYMKSGNENDPDYFTNVRKAMMDSGREPIIETIRGLKKQYWDPRTRQEYKTPQEAILGKTGRPTYESEAQVKKEALDRGSDKYKIDKEAQTELERAKIAASASKTSAKTGDNAYNPIDVKKTRINEFGEIEDYEETVFQNKEGDIKTFSELTQELKLKTNLNDKSSIMEAAKTITQLAATSPDEAKKLYEALSPEERVAVRSAVSQQAEGK